MAASIEATSAPRFVDLAPSESAHYLCLCDISGQDAILAFCQSEFAQGKEIDVLNHASVDNFEQVVAERVTALPMASHVYLCGSEAFVTRYYALVLKLGVSPPSISMVRSHDHGRNIQCAHCKSIYQNVTGRISYCSTCEVDLVIRDHFSPRYGAYQAVMISRDDPDFASLSHEDRA